MRKDRVINSIITTLAWQTSASAEDAAEAMGLTRKVAEERARILRRLGIPLKAMRSPHLLRGKAGCGRPGREVAALKVLAGRLA